MTTRRIYLVVLGGTLVLFIGAILKPLQQGKLPFRLGTDLAGGIIVTYTPDLARRVETCKDLSDTEVLHRCKDVVADRLRHKLKTAPDVVLRDDSRIVVTIPGGKNIRDVIELVGTTYHLTMRPVLGKPLEGPPREGYYRFNGENYRLGEVLVSGDMLDASRVKVLSGDVAASDPDDRCPSIQFGMRGAAADKFRRYTKDHVGESLATLVDDKIEMVAVIRSEIGGIGVITGRHTQKQAEDIALLLRSGNLLAPLEIESLSAVGPTLGQQVREQGALVFLLVLLLLLVVILIAYLHRTWFLLAGVVSLLCLQIAIVGLVALYGVTLDFPGIAGLILAVGMGMDAFIIIFESLETRLKSFTPRQISRNLQAIIREIYSFRREGGVLVHANLTTIIAVFLLLKADRVSFFAVFILIGILASVYTILVTREVLQRTYALAPDFGPSLIGWLRGKHFGLFRIHKLYLAVSCVAVMLAGYALVRSFTNGRGLRLGVDFQEGTQVICEARSTTNVMAAVRRLRDDMAPTEVRKQDIAQASTADRIRCLITMSAPLRSDIQAAIPTNATPVVESTTENADRDEPAVPATRVAPDSPGAAGLDDSARNAGSKLLTPAYLHDVLARHDVEIASMNSVDAKLSARRFFWSLSIVAWSLLLVALYLLFGQYVVSVFLTPRDHESFEPLGSAGWVSAGVLAALVHDLSFMVVACWLFKIEINLPVVAAALTMIGYSVNDSVVLWSQIQQRALKREHDYRDELMKAAEAKLRAAGNVTTAIKEEARTTAKKQARQRVGGEAVDIVTNSVDSVLSRAVLTSVSTLVAPVAILVTGLTPLADFAVVMLVGIAAGTFSSLFVVAAFALPTLRGGTLPAPSAAPSETQTAETADLSDDEIQERLG